ncbi:MAG TPA: hypothetical protein VIW26_02320 [Gemmatimonadales bacterium]
MKRLAFVFGTALALTGGSGCSTSSGPSNLAQVLVAPVLDSLFVGDSLGPLTVTYLGDNGQPQDPGTVTWSSSNPSVLSINATTGRIAGLQSGFSLVQALTHGIGGTALVVVSRSLQVSLLLDTLYFMPGDTFTIPVEVKHQAAGVPAVWFKAIGGSNAVFTVDSATGRDSAKATGGPLPFQVVAALGPDTVADTGAVRVLTLSDTTGGAGAYSILGTVIRRTNAAAQSTNYPDASAAQTFRLRLFITQGAVTAEAVVVTIRAQVTAAGTLAIDSISPAEALGSGSDPVCRPPRSWASWSTIASSPPIVGLSRPAGSVTVTQIVPVTGGFAISGRFSFLAQRTDFYADPLGVLPIRGTFVAPLTTTTGRC